VLAAQVEPRPKKEAAVRKALEELYKPKGETKKVRARRPLACVQRRLAVAHFYQKLRTASCVLQKLTTRMAAVSRPSRFPASRGFPPLASRGDAQEVSLASGICMDTPVSFESSRASAFFKAAVFICMPALTIETAA
jgi:hypothetical protein